MRARDETTLRSKRLKDLSSAPQTWRFYSAMNMASSIAALNEKVVLPMRDVQLQALRGIERLQLLHNSCSRVLLAPPPRARRNKRLTGRVGIDPGVPKRCRSFSHGKWERSLQCNLERLPEAQALGPNVGCMGIYCEEALRAAR